jgi:hypothetical protein
MIEQVFPLLIGAAFTFGVLVGSFITWGIDRVELAAYRRFARAALEPQP